MDLSLHEIMDNPTVDADTDTKAEVRETQQSKDKDHHAISLKLGLVIASLYLGTLLVAIDTTIITVAVPKISTVFKALDDIGWYGSGYLLTVTACQPSFGKVFKFFKAQNYVFDVYRDI